MSGLALYATGVEPNEISVHELTVPVGSLPQNFDGFRIALISDLHFAPFTGASEIDRAVAHINQLRPDVVTVVGDFVTKTNDRSRRTAARYAEPCAERLSGLLSPSGTLAVLGNHDHDTDPGIVATALQKHGVRVLRNENLPLERGPRRLWIAGIDDALAGAADVKRSLVGIPNGEPVIALVHEPDIADEVSRTRVALQLSGHSHGGQVRLPGLGAIYLPPLGKKYPNGLYRIGSMLLYTTRGIGVIGLPVRFDCAPEVTLIILRATSEIGYISMNSRRHFTVNRNVTYKIRDG